METVNTIEMIASSLLLGYFWIFLAGVIFDFPEWFLQLVLFLIVASLLAITGTTIIKMWS